MDKNSIIGFILMAGVLFGFTFYQSNQAKKQYAIQAQLDSIAMAEAAARAALEPVAEIADANFEAAEAEFHIYKDANLDAAHSAEGEIVTLENDVFVVEFNTKGAQPWSVMLKNYKNYGGSDLYIFRPGGNEYSASIYAGEYINTKDFNFEIASKTDNSIAFRLPFENGGYIEQSYEIEEGSYRVLSNLAIVGVNIPRNVGSIDLDFSTVIPRMEKGYKNESQYSKLDLYYNGDKKPEEYGRGRNTSKTVNSRIEWFAFQQQFFSAIIRAPKEFNSGNIAVNFLGENDPDNCLMACNANMRVDYLPGQEFSFPVEYYFGPNHFQTLKTYNHKFEKIIPLGGSLVGWFTRYIIITTFNFLHKFFDNFGLIILLMTLFIKILVFPFNYKSLVSSAKMSALRPEIEKLNEKYPKQEDALKKQQAQMDLYKRAGASPMGGCLPMLLTYPILWAMFRFFPASIELRQQRFLWAEDLSGYDSIVDFGFRVPLLGDHLSLFALLMAVVMFLYSKMSTSQQTAKNDPQAQSMNFMTVWMMPIMMFFICNNLSAGLSYYYLLSQLIQIVLMFIIRKSVKPEAVLAKVEASKGKPLPKSKWQQRLEEAQKLQEQQMRQQRRK